MELIQFLNVLLSTVKSRPQLDRPAFWHLLYSAISFLKIINFDWRIVTHLSIYIHIYISESESRSVMSDCLRPHGLYSPWNSPGQDTGVGSFSLLQRIFPTQESNWGLLHCTRILYQLRYQGSPIYICMCVYIYICIYPLFFGLPSHLGRQTALRRVPCATKQVLLSYPYST